MSSSSDRTDGDKPRPTGESNPVTPTIVGGRPPRNKSRGSGFPLGIEVLLKKASVDREFRKALLERRSQVAGEIGLDLSPSEAATLEGVPQSHIEKIIDKTTIPDEHRRVFLGKIGAAMLALVGLPLSGCGVTTGIRPRDRGEPRTPPIPRGIRPDPPPSPEPAPDGEKKHIPNKPNESDVKS